jgi:hypothetical protein
MSQEITLAAFRQANAKGTDWYNFRLLIPPHKSPLIDAKGLSEYQWCQFNCDDDWFTLAQASQVDFYLLNVVDAIPFRIRQKMLSYLGHDRFYTPDIERVAVNA